MISVHRGCRPPSLKRHGVDCASSPGLGIMLIESWVRSRCRGALHPIALEGEPQPSVGIVEGDAAALRARADVFDQPLVLHCILASPGNWHHPFPGRRSPCRVSARGGWSWERTGGSANGIHHAMAEWLQRKTLSRSYGVGVSKPKDFGRFGSTPVCSPLKIQYLIGPWWLSSIMVQRPKLPSQCRHCIAPLGGEPALGVSCGRLSIHFRGM